MRTGSWLAHGLFDGEPARSYVRCARTAPGTLYLGVPMGLSAGVRRLLLMALSALALLACDETVGDGTCAEDADCQEGETCLVDLTRGLSYCSRLCTLDSECPIHQSCRISHPRVRGLEDLEVRVCVDDVRTCGDVEICNGLDDDCDGVVDGDGCQIKTGCLDDLPCGGWLCQAPENQPEALCAPAIDGAADNFAECTQDAECTNGVCESGFCSPLCRPEDPQGCPSVFVDGETFQSVCARSVGDASRPKHNKCQVQCVTDNDCPNDLTCTWRDVYQAQDRHHWVCAIPDPARKPLGAACTNNEPDGGDDECQSGLCRGRRCTRPCGGPGASCRDIGPEFECATVELLYGELTYGAFVCLESD